MRKSPGIEKGKKKKKCFFYHLLKMSERISDCCIPQTLQSLPLQLWHWGDDGIGRWLTLAGPTAALSLPSSSGEQRKYKEKLMDRDKDELEGSGSHSCVPPLSKPAKQTQHRL